MSSPVFLVDHYWPINHRAVLQHPVYRGGVKPATYTALYRPALVKSGSGKQLVDLEIMPKGKADKTKGASAKSKAAAVTAPANPTPPSWPVFKPPLPQTDLIIESLVPGKVVLIRNFWPKSLCRDYVSFLRSLPLITTPSRPKKGEAARVNDRFQIEDPRFAQRLWLETGLKNALLDDEFRQSWYVFSL